MAPDDIRYPDWPFILKDILRDGEVVVAFSPHSLLSSELLYEARCATVAYTRTTHVVAIVRKDAAAGERLCFRRYDNDSAARQAGKCDEVSARQVWAAPCRITAVTARDSALHRSVGDVRQAGYLVQQRQQRRVHEQ